MQNDTTHLVALQTRLSHERDYLANARNAKEVALRTIWIKQIEKEIADEFAFLGMDATLPEMSDEDLLAQLGV